MLLSIDFDSKIPLYIQMYHTLKDKIHSNELATNEKLPSKRLLAKMNNVSENTVMNAYDQLLVEGYIFSIERKGYYVSNVEFHALLPELDGDEPKDEMEHVPSKSFAYDFTRSNPDEEIFPFSVFSKLYRELFNHSNEKLLGETSGQGLHPLRKQLQRYLSVSRGVPCSTEQIVLGPSTEYLLSILLQLSDSEVVLGLEDPGYQGFQQLMERLNISFDPISVNKGGLDIEQLSASDVNLMVVTSNHQFPTGNIMPLKQRQALLNWANESADRYIIENDYDSEFKYSGIPISSLKYLDQHNRVIHMGSFTRVLSPGIRLSYMVLPDDLLVKYQELFSAASSALSTFEQWIIHDFMDGGHFSTHLNRARTFYKKKRDKMIQAIQHHDAGANIFGEKAGLHLLVQPSFDFDGLHFKERAAESGIRLNLLSDYSYEKHPEFERVIFLSFSNISESMIDEVIENIFKLAQSVAKSDMI